MALAKNKSVSNIRKRIDALRVDINKCDERTPTITANIMDSINLSIRDNEISKEDGDKLKEELYSSSKIFERHCYCDSAQEREYQERHGKLKRE